MFDYNTISDVILHFDYTASSDESLRGVVQGAASGIVDSVQDRLESDGIVRAFSLKDEFPAQNARLVAGEEIDLNITSDFLPFFLQSAKVKAATLAFAGAKGEAASVGAVKVDGKQLGTVTTDDALGASTVALAGDSVPWHHRLQVTGMPADARSWLILKFTSN